MTQNKNRKFQVGDSVKVKNGTKDPDFGIDIGGWQGQITEIGLQIDEMAQQGQFSRRQKTARLILRVRFDKEL